MGNNALFIDTSGFYALIDRDDKNHKNIETILKKHNRLYTSNYIIDELITLSRVRKVTIENFVNFITALINGEICIILRISQEVDLEAWNMLLKFKEHDFSFTDCTSFILMKKHKITEACTLDNHFVIAGFDIAG